VSDETCVSAASDRHFFAAAAACASPDLAVKPAGAATLDPVKTSGANAAAKSPNAERITAPSLVSRGS